MSSGVTFFGNPTRRNLESVVYSSNSLMLSGQQHYEVQPWDLKADRPTENMKECHRYCVELFG